MMFGHFIVAYMPPFLTRQGSPRRKLINCQFGIRIKTTMKDYDKDEIYENISYKSVEPHEKTREYVSLELEEKRP